MISKEIALGNEILRGVVGSTSHGTAIEGQDDRDEMAVFIEPPENVCGLTPCDHYIYRDQPEGVRSQPGDLDLTMYSLRKFCRLAAQGNPSVIILLWLPDHVSKTRLGAELIGMREAFINRESGQRFLGYLVAQKMKLTGERTQTVARPELVEKYGYDTKFAMHALRLGFEGIEMLTHR
ncbi:MAG: nucleotidyltransferase domain-containing protein, partial [Patescibacteria group bacterium]|nr:nucleotidyltransferase domain-containing protein [Patescibacteria group bacterium]